MKILRLKYDEAWPHDYGFRASHAWCLPGVRCSTCGSTWGDNGLIYPSLILPPGLDPKPYQSHWAIKLDELRKLMIPLQKVIRPSLPVLPGMKFGPLSGTTHGKHGDFTWVGLQLPLISPEALRHLEELGISTLKVVPTTVVSRGKHRFAHLELEIEPHASIDPDGFPQGALDPCAGCGRISVAGTGTDFEKWDSYKILRSSVPGNLDLFRMREFSTYMFCTERFAAAALKLRLTNILFDEVALA